MTPNVTQDPKSQIITRFALRPAIFKIFRILWFIIYSYVKFQNLKLGRLPRKLTDHGKQCSHEVWLKYDENRWRSSVFKFPAFHGHVFRKKSKYHKILILGRLLKSNLYAPMAIIFNGKFGRNWTKLGEVAFWSFRSYMVSCFWERKKYLKIWKLKHLKKN